MIDRELIAAGFAPKADGSLTSPARVVLSPEGEFFRLTLALPGGDLVSCHISKRALKVCKGEKT